MPELVAGMRLNDDLVLERPVREGHENVWIAKHRAHGAVVVKLLPGELVTSPEARVRFSREIRAGSKIDSPHVVKRLDSGVTEDGVPFVVLELLVGEDLRTKLGRDAPLPPSEVAAFVRQIADALVDVHRAGIVHRDIKPENVFLCARDASPAPGAQSRGATGAVVGAPPLLKVLDFGGAKNVKNRSSIATSAGIVVGTPTYMSPEQMAGGAIDHQVDLWALSVVAFEALTGDRPFPGDDLQTIGRAALTGPRPKISAVERAFAPLDAFFERAFAVERAGRFTDAAELGEAFRRGVESLSDPQIPSTAGGRTRSLESFALQVKPQKTRGLALFIALVVVALAVAAWLFVRRAG